MGPAPSNRRPHAAALASLAALVVLGLTPSALAGPERAAGVGRLPEGGILLLPVRVQVYEVAPGSATLLKAEWTETALGWVRAAIDSVLGTARSRVVAYTAPADRERGERHEQVLRVHGAVRAAIVTHRYNPAFRLPSKASFAWSLGSGAAALREDQPTVQHALFVEISERRPSRHFVTFGTLANELTGTASVVDLGTGDVLWFNHERSGGLGSAAETQATVKRLLRDLPL
jgi:hypothetical protein